MTKIEKARALKFELRYTLSRNNVAAILAAAAAFGSSRDGRDARCDTRERQQQRSHCAGMA